MSEKWRCQPKEVIKSWLAALDERKIWMTLSGWEQKFVASLGWQVEKSGTISQRQQEILERIYTEKTK